MLGMEVFQFVNVVKLEMSDKSITVEALAEKSDLSASVVEALLEHPNTLLTLPLALRLVSALDMCLTLVPYADSSLSKEPVDPQIFLECWRRCGSPRDGWECLSPKEVVPRDSWLYALQRLRREPFESCRDHSAEPSLSYYLCFEVPSKVVHAFFEELPESTLIDVLSLSGRADQVPHSTRLGLLRRGLKHGNEAVRDAAIMAAEGWGDAALGAILMDHEDSNSDIRDYAHEVGYSLIKDFLFL